MRKSKPKTRQDLFIRVLNLWLENKRQCINEWGIGDRAKAHKQANEEYEAYLKLWDELKEQKNG